MFSSISMDRKLQKMLLSWKDGSGFTGISNANGLSTAKGIQSEVHINTNNYKGTDTDIEDSQYIDNKFSFK